MIGKSQETKSICAWFVHWVALTVNMVKVFDVWPPMHNIVEMCLQVARCQQLVCQARDVNPNNGEGVPVTKSYHWAIFQNSPRPYEFKVQRVQLFRNIPRYMVHFYGGGGGGLGQQEVKVGASHSSIDAKNTLHVILPFIMLNQCDIPIGWTASGRHSLLHIHNLMTNSYAKELRKWTVMTLYFIQSCDIYLSTSFILSPL